MNHRRHAQARYRGALVLAVALFASAQAGAQATSQIAAEALFQEARDLMIAGHFEAACPRLEESLRLDPALGTRLYLAQCYERTGKTATAWSMYRSAASAARNSGQTERARKAEKQALALEPRLPRITVEVPPAGALEGLEIKQDGTLLGRAVWGVPLPADPGEHAIVAAAPNKKVWTRVVNVADAQPLTVVIPELEDAERAASEPVTPTGITAPSTTWSTEATARPMRSSAAKGPQETPADSGGQQSSPSSGRLIAGGIVGLGGLAAVGVGVGFTLMANSKDTESDSYCGARAGFEDPNDCEQEGLDLDQEARDARIVSYVGFGVGAVAIAGSIILLVTRPANPASGGLWKPSVTRKGMSVTPVLTSRFGGLVARTTW